MGCCLSNISDNAEIYSHIPQLRDWMKEFRSLALSEKSVEKFWQIYKKIDMDGSGTIEIKEMLVHFDIDRTKFTKRVFSIFDEDNSGEIDLREFILALWNYCTLGKATLVIFAFDLYDKDGSGIIDGEELSQMLKEVYGNAYSTNVYAKRIMSNIQGMEVDAVDIDTFRKFVKKHPALLFPAFEMQSKMQKHTLGFAFWKRLAEKRLRLSNGQFVPIKKFMELHLETLAKEDKDQIRFSSKSTAGHPGRRQSAKASRAGSDRRSSVKGLQVAQEPARSERQELESTLDEALVQTTPGLRGKPTPRRMSMKPASAKTVTRRMSSIEVSMSSEKDLSESSKDRSALVTDSGSGGVPLEVGPPSMKEAMVDISSDRQQKRRNSTMTTQLPAIANPPALSESQSASPDVYDALVSAVREANQGKKSKRSFKSVANTVKVVNKYGAAIAAS